MKKYFVMLTAMFLLNGYALAEDVQSGDIPMKKDPGMIKEEPIQQDAEMTKEEPVKQESEIAKEEPVKQESEIAKEEPVKEDAVIMKEKTKKKHLKKDCIMKKDGKMMMMKEYIKQNSNWREKQ